MPDGACAAPALDEPPMTSPLDDFQDRLFGAFLAFFGSIGLALALWALDQPPPTGVVQQALPERIVAVLLDRPESPMPDREPAQTAAHGSGVPGMVREVQIEAVMRHLRAGGALDDVSEDIDLMVIREAFARSEAFEGGPVAAAGRVGVGDAREDGQVEGPTRFETWDTEVEVVAATRKSSLVAALAQRALPTLRRVEGPPRLPTAVHQRLVRDHRAQLESCFRALRQRDPRANGRLELAVDVVDGRVQGVRQTAQSVGDAQFVRCVTLRVRRWSFPSDFSSTEPLLVAFSGD